MSILDEMAADLGIGRADIARFLYAAPARYKVYQIPKRSGGTRTIAQPSATLKSLQRYVLQEKLSLLPVHQSASAYVTGRGIIDNASVHKRSRYILKLDFRDFFNSITVNDWRKLVDNLDVKAIDKSDSLHYERLLFWGAGGFVPKILSIGAPSSPMLSNIVMYGFDCEVAARAARAGAHYTRYADDITISASDQVTCLEVEMFIQNIVRTMRSPRLKLHPDKRGLYGPGERRLVTGLVITPDKAVSLGRERKRLMSAMMHRAQLGTLDVVGIGRLKGLLGLAAAVEPEFIGRLRTKYGTDAVQAVMTYQLPKRGS